MPEPLLFCLQLVQTFRDQATQAVPTTRGWTVDLWLKDRPLSAADAVPLTLGIHSRGDVSQPALTASCLKAAVGLIARTAELHSDLPSFPEVFAPALGVLKELHSLSEELPKVCIASFHPLAEDRSFFLGLWCCSSRVPIVMAT